MHQLFTIPELLTNIIANTEKMASCLLVNRNWFVITAPVVWSDPFHISSPKLFHMLVSSFLIDSDYSDCQPALYTILKKQKKFSPEKLTLPYLKYLNVLDYSGLIRAINQFINQYKELGEEQQETIQQQLTTSILKMLERNVMLKSLKVQEWNGSLDEDIYLSLFKFSNFISGIEELELGSDFTKVKFLTSLSNICHGITVMALNLASRNITEDLGKAEIMAVKKLIQSQTNLTVESFQIISREAYGNNLKLFLLPALQANTWKSFYIDIDNSILHLLKDENSYTVTQTGSEPLLDWLLCNKNL